MIQLNLGFSWIALDFPLEKHFLLCSSFAWNLCGKLNNIFRFFFSADWSIFHYFCGNLSFFRDFWFINFVDNIFAIVTSLERFFNVLLIIDFFVANWELALYFYRKKKILLNCIEEKETILFRLLFLYFVVFHEEWYKITSLSLVYQFRQNLAKFNKIRQICWIRVPPISITYYNLRIKS